MSSIYLVRVSNRLRDQTVCFGSSVCWERIHRRRFDAFNGPGLPPHDDKLRSSWQFGNGKPPCCKNHLLSNDFGFLINPFYFLTGWGKFKDAICSPLLVDHQLFMLMIIINQNVDCHVACMIDSFFFFFFFF